MKKITLLMILLISSLGFAQQQEYHLDFEEGTQSGIAANWFTFDNSPAPAEVVDNPDLDGVNATASKVMKVVVGPGNAFYAGVNNKWEDSKFGTWKLDMSVPNNLTLTMDVHKNYIGTVGIKMGTNAGGTTFEISNQNVGNTVVDEWQTLTFDLSGINPNGDLSNISQMVIFADWTQNMPDRAEGSTIYIDNIKFNAEKLTDAPEIPVAGTATLPIDFESETTWVDFDGGAVTTETNPHNNADNTSTNVGKMVKSAGQPWGGSSIALSSGMDFANNDMFTMKVYSPRAGAKVLLKVENSSDAGTFFEKEVETTVTNTWETLTFDYAAISKTNTYDKFVLIFDNGTEGDGSANFTFYLDDIALSSSGVVIPTVALPLDFESATTWGDFDGGAVTTLANPHNNADNSSENVGKMVKSAGQPWGGSSLNMSAGMDFANNDMFTMKVFSPRVGAKVLLKVEDSGNGTIFFEKEVATTMENTWETLTFDYTSINKANTYDKFVIIFDNGTEGDGSANFTFYIDDVVLFNSATAGVNDNELSKVSMYPNPTKNRLNISAQNTIKNAAIYNLLGKQIMSLEINKNSESIDVSNLSSGIYLIKYSVNNVFATAKFIKE
ncbi:T9SS type A sorting domain-containing protein [Polaribacter sp. Z014]|uniref:T9SS type A sorting domain-containing protein n=1 Tax=Polaribacter sp. Z014 TaxID=2927126 RepID=UPI00201FD11A|nr:T9SS type A sorting domain-containing protein [Polaribacter sp. Z014]MCL7762624.1 T9SS type A sorting domain-containing protein [Polaribacter sp. Z014]